MKKVSFFRGLSLPRKLILGFMGAILIGTFLLMLPISTTSGEGLDFLTALFTITSAVCVTGLSVIDISKELNTVGQVFLDDIYSAWRTWNNDFFFSYISFDKKENHL